jgi:YD repeat-containing protein
VQGETASSPRFTKHYENMLGQVINEERSGFKGVVLTTINDYDFFGRLVSSISDYEPTVEFTYDTLGNRISTIRSVGASVPTRPSEWRKTETLSSFVLFDSTIWLTQTNIVSCSDTAIAPLVSSSARQLTGLTVALPSRSRSIDVRGNITVNELLVDLPLVTSRQTVAYATNKSMLFSSYGVSLMDV